VTRRTDRVAEEIREEVARIIARELKDPRVGFVTVTRVDVTPDLHVARVHVGVLGDEAQRQKSMGGLKRAGGYVRRALGQRLRLRFTPEVLFLYDEGLDATDRVARLLDEVHKQSADTEEEET
jgi:ribosome-binding factor A